MPIFRALSHSIGEHGYPLKFSFHLRAHSPVPQGDKSPPEIKIVYISLLYAVQTLVPSHTLHVEKAAAQALDLLRA